jgi:hypothetical protein
VDGIIGDDPHALRRALAATAAGEPPEEAA